MTMQWIVQASSRSWSGSLDICMNTVQGKSAVFHTVERILLNFPDSKVVVAAPEFDRAGSLPSVLAPLGNRVEIYFGFSESPLKRMLAASRLYFQQNSFLRLDGLNMFFRPEHMATLWQIGNAERLDVVKFPDDYPVQFTADYYSVSALNRLSDEISDDSPHQIHPKFELMQRADFKHKFFKPESPITDDKLMAAREAARELYLDPRNVIDTERIITSGDTLSFHYSLALPFIDPSFEVLDIACGGWYGPSLLATKAKHVVGADIDPQVIDCASKRLKGTTKLAFKCEDVTAMSFADASFDLITSFETIEHVDALRYVAEMYRVLKPNGQLLLSTPQNSLGHIPT